MMVLGDHGRSQFLLVNSTATKSPSVSGGLNLIGRIQKHLKVPVLELTATNLDSLTVERTINTLKLCAVESERHCLLVAGAYLDDQITILSLTALAHGFNVFLLRDLLEAKQLQHAQVHDARLVQAGCVPTTLRQMLYQWTTVEAGDDDRESLLELLSDPCLV